MTRKEFLKLTRKQPNNGCWIWLGRYFKGRAKCKSKDHPTRMAARLACQLFGKRIPKGMCGCHKCDNPACVRPAHIFSGTDADNFRDMRAKGRGACFKGAANPMYGRTHTAAARASISLVQKFRVRQPYSAETRAKISKAAAASHYPGRPFNVLPAQEALKLRYANNPEFRKSQGEKIKAGFARRLEGTLGPRARMINFKSPWLIRLLFPTNYEQIFEEHQSKNKRWMKKYNVKQGS